MEELRVFDLSETIQQRKKLEKICDFNKIDADIRYNIEHLNKLRNSSNEKDINSVMEYNNIMAHNF